MTILYHDVQRASPDVEAEFGATFLPLEDLLPKVDFVSLHVNLTHDTHGLINADKLAWMKPTAVLVNTSRGPVVNGADLADALRTGQICGRRARRDRPRADPRRRPAPVARQLPGRAAHRVGVARDPRQDGRDGGREPARRRARRADPDAGQPRGLRPMIAGLTADESRRRRRVVLGAAVAVGDVSGSTTRRSPACRRNRVRRSRGPQRTSPSRPIDRSLGSPFARHLDADRRGSPS